MLSCVCYVIDHRWRQNVVRTKKNTEAFLALIRSCLMSFIGNDQSWVIKSALITITRMPMKCQCKCTLDWKSVNRARERRLQIVWPTDWSTEQLKDRAKNRPTHPPTDLLIYYVIERLKGLKGWWVAIRQSEISIKLYFCSFLSGWKLHELVWLQPVFGLMRAGYKNEDQILHQSSATTRRGSLSGQSQRYTELLSKILPCAWQLYWMVCV